MCNAVTGLFIFPQQEAAIQQQIQAEARAQQQLTTAVSNLYSVSLPLQLTPFIRMLTLGLLTYLYPTATSVHI